MMNQLNAMLAKIDSVLAERPECFITHPTELKILHGVSSDDLRQLARERGWRLIARVGGRVLEFYNDVTVQALQSGRNMPVDFGNRKSR
jgi:branched-subunit amino acid aminotransferase/4-amino-4-deoxychorismate lyase